METKVIDARATWWRTDLKELWAHRELLWVFVQRGISTRYRQMVLGLLWSVLEPLALLLMMTAVFGFFLRVPTGGYPYPVFAFAALVPWLLFSKTTMSTASSLLDNMSMISKIYFPRMLLPVSAGIRELYDVAITLTILMVMAAVYGFAPGWRVLALPLVVLYAALAGLAIGLWCAAVMVRLRDIRPILTIVLQLGMYATPIMYSVSVVPESVRPYYVMNPMYWAVEASRWVMLGQPLEITPAFYVSGLLVLALFVSGVFVFSLYERMTVDVQ